MYTVISRVCFPYRWRCVSLELVPVLSGDLSLFGSSLLRELCDDLSGELELELDSRSHLVNVPLWHHLWKRANLDLPYGVSPSASYTESNE